MVLTDLVQGFVVEVAASPADDEGGQADRGQVADRDFIRRGVLDDLGAEVRALDGAQVLLVALPLQASLYMMYGIEVSICNLENLLPQVLRLDGALATAFGFVLGVEFFELVAPAVGQAGAEVGHPSGSSRRLRARAA